MKKLLYLFCCVFAVLLVGCEPTDPPTSNKIETGAYENIAKRSATVKGVVNVDISAYNSIEFGVMYSTDLDEVNNRSAEMVSSEVLMGKDFKVELGNLSAVTKYYYCAYLLLNGMQYEFGAVKEFTTLASNPSDGSFVEKPFSVSASKTITFSPGNLQYHAAKDEWRFAPNQTDNIALDNSNISPSYNGWIDLFGWGTGNNPTNISNDVYDYQTFVDWGVNRIGNYPPNTWRTLTNDEWSYLFSERSNASNLVGCAVLNGVTVNIGGVEVDISGLILLPDAWVCPNGITFKPGFTEYSEMQSISTSDWSKLEASGAVFLPAAGVRWGSDAGAMLYGEYWSSTGFDSGNAYGFGFSIYQGHMGFHYESRFVGQSVRLVLDN